MHPGLYIPARRGGWRSFALLLAVGTATVIVAFASSAADAAATQPALKSPTEYGLWVLLPAGAAIVCAVICRQVVPSLILGVVVASVMLLPCKSGEGAYDGSWAVIRVARMSLETFVIGAAIDADHMRIIFFSLIISGMVGVIGASGGTRAIVDIIARHASNPRRGQLTAWFAGLVVFFDDYANSMIVGPTMQPICDRLGISRAKLAYIVDSTAAPVASIALIGTWVGAEVGFIQEGINAATGAGAEFLNNTTALEAFLGSLPYRFYPIFSIFLVFWIAVTGRDIGPMRRAEAEAVAVVDEQPAHAESRPAPWWLGGLPIIVLVLVTCAIIAWPAITSILARDGRGYTEWLKDANAYASILYGSIASLTSAMVLTLVTRSGTLRNCFDWMTEGMGRLIGAVMVLVLAWALSSASQELMVGEVVQQWLIEKKFSLEWMPVAVFASAALVSFATGTSWGTMGILCPMVVIVASGLAADMPADRAMHLFYGSVGSVLAGAIFGDHCSPISDTTVLSSVATGCSLEQHVWTQLPYAMTAAAVGMLAGDVLCARLNWSPAVGIAAGVVLLIIWVRILGRRPLRDPV